MTDSARALIQGKLAMSFRQSGGWSFQALDLIDRQLMGRSETVATLWEPRIMAVTPFGMRLMGFERSEQGYEGTAGVVQEWMVELDC